jgi:hypothetical protein
MGGPREIGDFVGVRLDRFETDVLVRRLAVVADHDLAELRFVAGHVLRQQVGQQLQVVGLMPIRL